MVSIRKYSDENYFATNCLAYRYICEMSQITSQYSEATHLFLMFVRIDNLVERELALWVHPQGVVYCVDFLILRHN